MGLVCFMCCFAFDGLLRCFGNLILICDWLYAAFGLCFSGYWALFSGEFGLRFSELLVVYRFLCLL